MDTAVSKADNAADKADESVKDTKIIEEDANVEGADCKVGKAVVDEEIGDEVHVVEAVDIIQRNVSSARSSPGAFSIPGLRLERQDRLIPPSNILVNASVVDDEQPTLVFEASPLRRKGNWKWIITVAVLFFLLTLAVAVIFMQASGSQPNIPLPPISSGEPREATTDGSQFTMAGDPTATKSEENTSHAPSLSDAPSTKPTSVPSMRPSSSPTQLKSKYPSSIPTQLPSERPSERPSRIPSMLPSENPSYRSSEVPSNFPSMIPSTFPSVTGSTQPSVSISPSIQPSAVPTLQPSDSPTSSRNTIPIDQIGQALFGDSTDENIGRNVKLSSDGTVLAVSSHLYDSRKDGDDVGKVQVYKLKDGLWVTKGQEIDGNFAGDQAGYSMDLSDDGSIIAVGSWTAGSFLEGIVRVYLYSDELDFWYRLGQELQGESSAIFFGSSVSLSSSGQTVAIGADLDSKAAVNAGMTQIFRYNYSLKRWEQLGQTISGENEQDRLGSQVVLAGSGDMVAVGVPTERNLNGHVKTFVYDGNDWVALGSPIKDYHFDTDSVTSSIDLSFDGLTMAVRTPFNLKMLKFDASIFDWVENTPEILAGTLGPFSLSPDGHTMAVTKISGWFGSSTIFVDIYRRDNGNNIDTEWKVEESFLLPINAQPASIFLSNHALLGVGCPECSASPYKQTRSANFGTSVVISF